MKAMVMAAGFGTRLRPLTYLLPKQLLPIANLPVMHHLLDGLRLHGITELGSNVHYLADTFYDYFGDGSGLGVSIRWSYEEELLGTAGGVKLLDDLWRGERILVTSGDGLHDVDYTALIEQHRRTGALATLVVKEVSDPSEYGVVVTDGTAITAFQEKPKGGTALSNLANCGVYVIEPQVLERVPPAQFYDFGTQLWPELVEEPGALHAYTTPGYWNDVGGLEELRAGSLDAVAGRVRVALAGDELEPGVRCGDGCRIDVTARLEGPLAIGRNVVIEGDAVVQGPAAIGADCHIGAEAAIRHAVVLPGTQIPDEGLAVGGIVGDGSALAESVLRYPATARV